MPRFGWRSLRKPQRLATLLRPQNVPWPLWHKSVPWRRSQCRNPAALWHDYISLAGDGPLHLFDSIVLPRESARTRRSSSSETFSNLFTKRSFMLKFLSKATLITFGEYILQYFCLHREDCFIKVWWKFNKLVLILKEWVPLRSVGLVRSDRVNKSEPD